MLVTRLELFFRQTGLRPMKVAREMSYSRQHLLRVRLGETEPTRRFIRAITATVSKQLGETVQPSRLFERADEFLAGRGERLRRVHADDLATLDSLLPAARDRDWVSRVIDTGVISETAVRHLWRVGTRRIDQQPAEAAAIFHAAAMMAAKLRGSPPQLVAALQAHALKGRANALRHLGRYEAALSDLRLSTTLFARTNLCAAEAGQVEYTRGTILFKMERWNDAADAARTARRFFMRTADVRRIAHADNLIAVSLFEKGSVDEARGTWLDLERRWRAIKSPEDLARVWQNLAAAETRRGRPKPARDYLNRASSTFRALGNQTELTRTRWNMATYLATFRNREVGIFALRRVSRAFEALGVHVDAACVGLEIVELMISDAPPGDPQLTQYAQQVASTLVRAGLPVSAAAALDQLRRIAHARDRRAVLAEVRLAMRDLDLSCHAPWLDSSEAGAAPGLAEDP